jgi:hypothetical protein
MTNFVFTDRNGKPCLIFDLCVLGNVYSHWDLNQSLDILFELVDKEIKNINKKLVSYSDCDFRDEETKKFLTQQSSNIVLHLKRFKNFLDEGITKNYKSYIEI